MNIINKLISDGCTEDILLDYLKKDDASSDIIFYTNIMKYAVVNSFIKICDEIPNVFLLAAICKYTDNVELYLKYYQNNDRLFEHVCLSLFYTTGPSRLTEYIVEKYKIDIINQPDFVIFNDADNDQDKFEQMSYVIDKFKISYCIDNYKLFKFLTEDFGIIIIEKLLNNNMNDQIIDCAVKLIIDNCSLHNIEIFIEKYLLNRNLSINLLHSVTDYDIFIYLIRMVDESELNFNDNNFKFLSNHMIVKQLIMNGYTVRPKISLVDDYQVACLIIQDAALNNDLVYLYDNTEGIIIMFLDSINVFDIIPSSILDQDVIYCIANRYSDENLINILVQNKYPIDLENTRYIRTTYPFCFG